MNRAYRALSDPNLLHPNFETLHFEPEPTPSTMCPPNEELVGTVRTCSTPNPETCVPQERIFIELITLDRKLKASREGPNPQNYRALHSGSPTPHQTRNPEPGTLNPEP